MSSKDGAIRDKIYQNDVTMARSYLEVDVMEWFSNEEVPFGYEAFVIPSLAGPGRDKWDATVEAIQAVGNDNFQKYDKVVDDSHLEGMRPVELLSMWNDIYDKHRLQEERVTVEVKRSLSNFSKKMILPDFALYMDYDGTLADEDFDWSSWDYIVEVSGLWGVGLPDEAGEDEWWSWYRVSAVAFKELMYKLLGVWDSVRWVVPFQPYIEGVSDGIPKPIRDDDQYVIAHTTRSDLGMEKLADELGISLSGLDSKLSAPITPAEYERPSHGMGVDITRVDYTYDRINMDNVSREPMAIPVQEGVVLYHGELGDAYVTDGGVMFRESQWEYFNMLMLREYALEVLRALEDSGIVEELEER